MSDDVTPIITVISNKGQTIEDWPDDETAAATALRRCQDGLGGLFPNGTAGMFTSPEDQAVHTRRKAHLNRLADALESGEARIVWLTNEGGTDD